MYVERQYDSCKAWLGKYSDNVGCVDPMDSMRVKSYQLYDDFYANRPEAFSVTLRGDSDTEIYLPVTKKMIDSTARFLAVDFDFVLKGGSTDSVNVLLRNIFKREAIRRKFIRAKKSGLTRGDSLWYVTADPNKKDGERISIHTVNPGYYFPIEDIENSERIIGCHLVDLVHDPRDKENDKNKKVVRRQTYRKRDDVITFEIRIFEKGGWDDRPGMLKPSDLKPVSVLRKEEALPPQITSLPIYHIPNNEPDGSSWGTSQISGIEYIINGLNQSITYEDLTLILQGLGVYTSTAGPPVNQATGAPSTYNLRPGDVVELNQGDRFERVTGISSIAPYQDHMKFLDTYAGDGLGIPDMAQGSVDVAVAQSGIALALKMGPIIAENQDKQESISSKWDQLGYDLIRGWFPAYEGINSPETTFETTFGDPMPVNREAIIKELIDLYTANLVLAEEVRDKLEKLGYENSSGLTEKLMDESRSKSAAATGDMFTQEAGAGSPDLVDSLGYSMNGQP